MNQLFVTVRWMEAILWQLRLSVTVRVLGKPRIIQLTMKPPWFFCGITVVIGYSYSKLQIISNNLWLFESSAEHSPVGLPCHEPDDSPLVYIRVLMIVIGLSVLESGRRHATCHRCQCWALCDQVWRICILESSCHVSSGLYETTTFMACL